MRALLLIVILFANLAIAAIPEVTSYQLPINCSELLPDNGPFIAFFEAVARGQATKDRNFSKHLFRILFFREKLATDNDWIREQNPIDLVIRKTLCFFREQKEPLKAIAFDNEEFAQFLKKSIKELENKINQLILDVEIERNQRRQYELKLARNQAAVEALKREAAAEALRSYETTAAAAKRKLGAP
ncbi:MAG: hypothetical protein HY537_10725 [Deltaproteobacteria bacterium]|nr:hypothetical protein [Deltaproteobacteria bacterium]